MGAAKWQTIYKVVLPAVGILTGVILGIGRVAGRQLNIRRKLAGPSNSIGRPGRTMAVHLYTGIRRIIKNNMYATATVLIITVLIINFTANRLIKRFIKA